MSGFVKKKTENRPVRKLILCALTAFVISMLIVFLFALISYKIPGADRVTYQLSIVCVILCGLTCGIVCGKHLRGKSALAALLSLVNLLLLISVALLSGAYVTELVSLMMKVLFYSLSAGVGILITVRRSSNKRVSDKRLSHYRR